MGSQIITDKKARDKPCLRCGYSLRQIPDARHCPECGLSVWLSLNQDNALDRSNPTWLASLAKGSAILAIAQVLAFALSVTWERLLGSGWIAFGHSPLSALFGAIGVYLIIFHTGMFLLAVPEKRHPDHLRIERATVLVFAIFGWIMGSLLVLQSLVRLIIGLRSMILFIVWQTAAGVAFIGGTIATLAYLRKIARRIPNHHAARLCEWLMVPPLLAVLFAVPYIGMIFLFHLGWFITYVPWVYLPATGALFAWFAITFRRASIAAEREWTSETAGAGAL